MQNIENSVLDMKQELKEWMEAIRILIHDQKEKDAHHETNSQLATIPTQGTKHPPDSPIRKSPDSPQPSQAKRADTRTTPTRPTANFNESPNRPPPHPPGGYGRYHGIRPPEPYGPHEFEAPPQPLYLESGDGSQHYVGSVNPGQPGWQLNYQHQQQQQHLYHQQQLHNHRQNQLQPPPQQHYPYPMGQPSPPRITPEAMGSPDPPSLPAAGANIYHA
jgi:hypothetical protein